jgi:flavin-binding protein dodecin
MQRDVICRSRLALSIGPEAAECRTRRLRAPSGSESWIMAAKEMRMDRVYKLVEIVGTSKDSIEKAIASAVDRAGKSLHNLDWFEVCETRGRITDGKVDQYQVKIKVGFRLDE